MVTGVEVSAIAAGLSSAYAYYLLVTAMASLLAATTLGAALVALAHGVHAGVNLGRGIAKIADSELRALVRVNYTLSGSNHKQSFVIRKKKHERILKIYKIKTETLLFHKRMASTYSWPVDSEWEKVDCSAFRQSGFVDWVVSSGLVTGDVESKCLRMPIGTLVALMAQALPENWTGEVACLGETTGLMISKCDASLKNKMHSGRCSLRYFEALQPLMAEYVDVA